MVFLQSPQGDEIKEVEATAVTLSPLVSAGWHQVPVQLYDPTNGMVTMTVTTPLQGICPIGDSNV